MQRASLFLLRQPLIAVVAALAVLATIAGAVAAFHAQPAQIVSEPTSEPAVAPATLPTATELPRAKEVNPAADALHELERTLDRNCARPDVAGEHQRVRRLLKPIESFARAHPNSAFRIDGELSTTLALLIVVRNLLQECDPTLLPGIDALIPDRYRE